MKDSLNNITGVLPIGPKPVLILRCDGSDLSSVHTLILDVIACSQVAPELRVHVCVLHGTETSMAVLGLLTALRGMDHLSCTFEAIDVRASDQLDPVLDHLPLYRANIVVQNTGGATVLFKRNRFPLSAQDFQSLDQVEEGVAISASQTFCVAAGQTAAAEVITKSGQLHALFEAALDGQTPSWPADDLLVDRTATRESLRVESSELEALTIELSEQLWRSAGAGPRVLVFAPPVDLSFQLSRLATFETRQKIAGGSLAPLRKSWHIFANRVVEGLKAQDAAVVKLTIPLWFMTPVFINLLAPKQAVMPHRQPSQMDGLRVGAWFYMQVFFQFLFTCDQKGWGPWASHYPVELDGPSDNGRPLLDELNTRLVAQNASKFKQPERMSRGELIEQGLIPDAPFIFFPCQIPHDEQIRFFSDIALVDLVSALSSWANNSNVHVVFKGHPMNRLSMEPLQQAAPESDYVRWVNGSIHDLIEQATAVYTLNSGTGLEAILHGKPVVTFARTEYDCISINGDIEDLDACWQAVDAFDNSTALAEQNQFLNQLIDVIGYDVDADWDEQQTRYAHLARRILNA